MTTLDMPVEVMAGPNAEGDEFCSARTSNGLRCQLWRDHKDNRHRAKDNTGRNHTWWYLPGAEMSE